MCYNVYTKIVGAFDCAPLIVPAHDMVLNLQSRRENFTRYQILRAVKSAGRKIWRGTSHIALSGNVTGYDDLSI